MLSPAKTKFRKQFKGKIHGNAYAGAGLQFGEFGLKAVGAGRMSNRQIEAARRCISRAMKRDGKFWNRMFPHLIVTAKPADTRMGGGKGSLDRYVAKVYPGNMLFEVSGVAENVARLALDLAGMKLPFDVKFVKKEEGVHATYK